MCILCIPLLPVAAVGQSWQSKQIADWNDEDEHQVLSESPWAKSVTPKLNRSANNDQGAGSGMGVGAAGMGRRGGSHSPSQNSQAQGTSSSPAMFTVRWESALPIQAAELKARNVNAPTVDENHYAIAVYGIPSRMVNSSSTPGLSASALEDQLKDQAAIKRDGQKDLKPSGVEVLPRDDGTIVVYFFPRSKEITLQDKQVEFSAQIARFQVLAVFEVQAMIYQGKLEL